jgi:hypothetical protein
VREIDSETGLEKIQDPGVEKSEKGVEKGVEKSEKGEKAEKGAEKKKEHRVGSVTVHECCADYMSKCRHLALGRAKRVEVSESNGYYSPSTSYFPSFFLSSFVFFAFFLLQFPCHPPSSLAPACLTSSQ